MRRLLSPRSLPLAALVLALALVPRSGWSQDCTYQPTDPAYDAQIKANTTLPNFSTELVDHVPSDSCVPSPDQFFGHIIGAPNVLDNVEKTNEYLRLLASKSKRVKVFSIGRSEEGHEMVMAAVSDEATIADLDHYRDITAKLADPRGLSEADAQALIRQGKPMYWAAGSIHSTETGSPEMLMELAYRLAVEETPFIQTIRKNAIILITPQTETDGRDRDVELYMHSKAHPGEATPALIWWGHYVDHDNNRDGLTLSLDLSKNLMRTFLAWHPTVMHDLHESEPYLYIQTGTGPYNPWLDPMDIDEWQSMAYYEIDNLTKRNVIGVWTHGFFDGWGPNYMLYVAIGHNAIGRFYETQGNGGADTRQITTPAADTTREWYRPNPPLATVLWSARDNANLEESGLLFGMYNMASNAQEFLSDFYLKSKRSVAKATTEGPAAWVFPAGDTRPGAQAWLLDVLQLQGVEVSKATEAFTAADQSFPVGSYIIRMDQPYSREADMLLDRQYYNPTDPPPYDDTGWTMGDLANVKTVRVQDPAILKVAMTRVTDPVAAPSGVSGAGSVFLVNNNADANLASFRYRLASTPMQAAEAPFDAAGHHFRAGSFIITGANADAIAGAARDTGVTVIAADAAPNVPMHELAHPRIALMHNWQNTQQDGWYRIAMDRLHIPYTYIADTKVRVTPNLKDSFDVLILPPMGGSLASMINGIAMRGNPIAWKNTPDMPDLAPPGLDSTDDIRGGLGLSGIVNIEQFVNDGGLLIAVGPSMVIATDTGMAEGVSTAEPPAGLDVRGDVLQAEVSDANSPIAYGYDPPATLQDNYGLLDVYYSQGLMIAAGGGRGGRGGGGRGAGAGPERASGTGGPDDRDVIQTRPYDLEYPPEGSGGRGGGAGGGFGGRGGGVPPAIPPRVVVRLSTTPNDLLVSGLLAGAQSIAGTPLVVDSVHGKGHVVLFAANPMWRNETTGELALVFNAMMNYQHLDVGRSAAGRGGRGRGRGGDR